MKTRLALCALVALSLSACATTLRTSTAEERAAVNRTILVTQEALIWLQAAGKLDDEQYALAVEQLAEVRQMVADSAERPVDWGEVMLRVSAMAARWFIPVPQETP